MHLSFLILKMMTLIDCIGFQRKLRQIIKVLKIATCILISFVMLLSVLLLLKFRREIDCRGFLFDGQWGVEVMTV
jgi:hypothetical protein